MLTKLTLQNFKCFAAPYEFELKKINVFTGYNGRGKSTAFQSLLLLAQSYYDNGNLNNLLVNGIFCKLGLFEDLLNKKTEDKIVRISVDTDSASDFRSVKFGYKEESDRKGVLTSMMLDGEEKFAQTESIAGGPKSKESFMTVYPSSVNSIFKNFAFVSAERLGPTAFEVKQDLYDNNSIGNNGEFRLNVLAGKEELKHQLGEIIARIMHGGIMKLHGDDSTEKSNDVLHLYFNTIDDSNIVKAINNGFGYSYVIPVLLSALTMNGGCLFIENPEAHLHPFAQSQLTKELIAIALKNNIQLFIETHSEHVMNAIRLCSLYDGNYTSFTNVDASFYFFDKNMNVTPLNLLPDGQIENWPLGFFDQAERDAAEILKLGLFKS